jgi:hypothetical protein
MKQILSEIDLKLSEIDLKETKAYARRDDGRKCRA